MRRDNKHLANQLSKVLEDKARVEKQSELLSRTLEELKKLRAAALFELEKQKRLLYGRKSEKSSSLVKGANKDLKNEKNNFDAPLRNILLNKGRFLFCDETTEIVKILNKVTGKFGYSKK